MLAASVIRQALVPMTAFYLILMAALGLGLLRWRRSAAGAAPPGGSPGLAATTAGAARGRVAMARQVLTTVVGGYLLLMVVVVVYYYAIARVGGAFLQSAVTGAALLIGLALPVFAAASWVSLRRHGRDSAVPGDPRRPPGQ